MRIVFFFLLSVFNAVLLHWLNQSPAWYRLDAYAWESDDFRAMELGPAAAQAGELDFQKLAALMLERDFDLTEFTDPRALEPDSMPFSGKPGEKIAEKGAAFRKLARAYETVLADLRYFPIPASNRSETPPVAYEDSWQQSRTYGGERGHEGCDIMGNQRPRGFYPVISASDGVVEKMGWLEQGGWRLGIRTPSGAYLYYAHLYSYAGELEEGVAVKAGQLLGYMGDSGYGKQENTVGNFEVHLHFGIYLRTDHYEELSVNPYWILRRLEERRLIFDY